MLATALPDLVLDELGPGDAQAFYDLLQQNRTHLTGHGDFTDEVAAPPRDGIAHKDARGPGRRFHCRGLRRPIRPRPSPEARPGYSRVPKRPPASGRSVASPAGGRPPVGAVAHRWRGKKHRRRYPGASLSEQKSAAAGTRSFVAGTESAVVDARELRHWGKKRRRCPGASAVARKGPEAGARKPGERDERSRRRCAGRAGKLRCQCPGVGGGDEEAQRGSPRRFADPGAGVRPGPWLTRWALNRAPRPHPPPAAIPCSWPAAGSAAPVPAAPARGPAIPPAVRRRRSTAPASRAGRAPGRSRPG